MGEIRVILHEDQIRLKEFEYVCGELAPRLRPIVSYMADGHSRFKQSFSAEEILDFVHTIPNVDSSIPNEYDIDNARRDLEWLVNHNNAESQPDYTHAKTINDYLAKRNRYRLTEATIRIENMLDTLFTDAIGGSFNTSDFDALRNRIVEFKAIYENKSATGVDLESGWKIIFATFEIIQRDATAYVRRLQGEDFDARLQDDTFIDLKAELIVYLQSFHRKMTETHAAIEKELKTINLVSLERCIKNIVSYAKKARFEEPNEEAFRVAEQELFSQWMNLRAYFLQDSPHDSPESVRLRQIALRVIEKIAQYANEQARLVAPSHGTPEEFRRAATWFSSLENIDACHELATLLFGAFHIRHIFTPNPIEQNHKMPIWSWHINPIEIVPQADRVRTRTTRKAAIANRVQERKALEVALLHEMDRRKRIYSRLFANGSFFLSSLSPGFDAETRLELCSIILRCMDEKEALSVNKASGRGSINVGKNARTHAYGAYWVQLSLPNPIARARIQFIDGILEAPDYFFEILNPTKGEKAHESSDL